MLRDASPLAAQLRVVVREVRQQFPQCSLRDDDSVISDEEVTAANPVSDLRCIPKGAEKNEVGMTSKPSQSARVSSA